MNTEGKKPVEFFKWPDGKKAAVSLTFDDARISQADFTVPLFNSSGIRGTFYLSPDRAAERREAWQKAADAGHELGCHTYLHPCSEGLRASKVYLEDYGLQRMEADIDRSLEYLYSLSGMRARSFAYPCGQTYVGREGRRQSYIPLVASRFMSGRGYPSLEINDPLSCNMEYLQSVKYDGIAIETVRELTGKALSSGGWLIFTGHETPEEFPVLKETIAFLSSQDSLWIDTVGAITEYILGNR